MSEAADLLNEFEMDFEPPYPGTMPAKIHGEIDVQLECEKELTDEQIRKISEDIKEIFTVHSNYGLKKICAEKISSI